MTTGCPRLCEILSPTTRATMAGAPPGGIVTRMWIGRDGNCAKAALARMPRKRSKAIFFMPRRSSGGSPSTDSFARARGKPPPPRRSPARPSRRSSVCSWQFRSALVDLAVFHGQCEPRGILEDSHVARRVAIHHQQVGEVARLDLPQLVATAHELAAELGGGDQRLDRRVAEELDEPLQVARVRADRVVREAVVAAGEDADPALAHFRVELLHALELGGRSHVFFRAALDAPFLRFVSARVDEANRRGDEDLLLLRFKQVERFLVGVAAVVDDAEAMLRRALHRLRGLRVAGEVDAALARLVADRRDFFLGVGELLRAARRERVVAREQEFDGIDARFRHLPDVAAQGIWAT